MGFFNTSVVKRRTANGRKSGIERKEKKTDGKLAYSKKKPENLNI